MIVNDSFEARIRMATDAMAEELLAREKALRAVERDFPALDLEGLRSAEAVYCAALEQMGVDPKDLKSLDLAGLAALYQVATNAARGRIDLPNPTGAADAAPGGSLAAISPVTARIRKA